MKSPTNPQKNNSSKRGFASMSKEKQRAIASKGGTIAHQLGKAHEFTSKEASEAGKKRTRTKEV